MSIHLVSKKTNDIFSFLEQTYDWEFPLVQPICWKNTLQKPFFLRRFFGQKQKCIFVCKRDLVFFSFKTYFFHFGRFFIGTFFFVNTFWGRNFFGTKIVFFLALTYELAFSQKTPQKLCVWRQK